MTQHKTTQKLFILVLELTQEKAYKSHLCFKPMQTFPTDFISH